MHPIPRNAQVHENYNHSNEVLLIRNYSIEQFDYVENTLHSLLCYKGYIQMESRTCWSESQKVFISRLLLWTSVLYDGAILRSHFLTNNS